MDLPLNYPTKDLNTVEVGLITIEVVELASNRANIIDGTLPLKILNSFCPKLKEEQIKELSLSDANRILVTAFRQTYDTSGYVAKVNCPDCKKLVFITHDFTKPAARVDGVYDKVHKFITKDPLTLKEREHLIKLRPLKFNINCELIKRALNEGNDDWAKLLILGRIESIDGKEITKMNQISMPIYKFISSLTDPDIQATNDLLSAEGTCVCGKVVPNTLSWLDGNFLQAL